MRSSRVNGDAISRTIEHRYNLWLSVKPQWVQKLQEVIYYCCKMNTTTDSSPAGRHSLTWLSQVTKDVKNLEIDKSSRATGLVSYRREHQLEGEGGWPREII